MSFNCKNICNDKNSLCPVVRALIRHSLKIILKKFNLIPGMPGGLKHRHVPTEVVITVCRFVAERATSLENIYTVRFNRNI